MATDYREEAAVVRWVRAATAGVADPGVRAFALALAWRAYEKRTAEEARNDG
jgi:hypothetical protein